jgi:hypothetical protein
MRCGSTTLKTAVCTRRTTLEGYEYLSEFLIHRGFIGVGYDGGQNVRDEELSVGRKKSNREQTEETKQSRWGFRGMTVREWLELLIVPLMLALITVVFTWQQNERQQDLETKRTNHAQKIENQRAESEQDIEEQRTQDAALQAYLDQMSSLMIGKNSLRNSEEDSEVRTLARARTLTVLGRLDPKHKKAVVQFLVDAKLVQSVDERPPIVGLSGANLSGANLEGADLSGADLSDVNLENANLDNAYLDDANLERADLDHATMENAFFGPC